MSNWNLCTIRPRGFAHSSAFEEVKSSLAWALTALGHDCILTENSFSASKSTNIIYGAELLPPDTKLPAGSIVFNYEQPTHPRMELVRKLVKANNCRVWDYSARNVGDWGTLGVQTVHVPVGYTPNLTRIPKADTQDIDVLFYGWLTARRIKIINDLKAAGLNVVATASAYGGARDNLISRAKVVLNVHHDGRDMFEAVRVSYLLANSKWVLSEDSSDQTDYLDWAAVELCEYTRTVEVCKQMLAADHICYSRGLSAFEVFSKQDYVATVARALGPQFTHKPIPGVINEVMASLPVQAPLSLSTPLHQRYYRACQVGDMVDFAPWLREHAKGQILEIGVRDGASTSAFLLGLEDRIREDLLAPKGHLTSIDIDDCSGLWTHPQWTFIQGSSIHISFVERFHDGQFDLALIDGCHNRDAFIGDLYNCYHWVKPGGIILAHDIVPERGHEFYAVGLREEFYKFAASHPELKVSELPGRYGMGVMEKPL